MQVRHDLFLRVAGGFQILDVLALDQSDDRQARPDQLLHHLVDVTRRSESGFDGMEGFVQQSVLQAVPKGNPARDG